MPKTGTNKRILGENSSLVTLADIFPTFVEIAGGTSPERCDGINLISLAKGEVSPRKYLDGVVGGVNAHNAHLAITDGRWKYLWFTEGGYEQLFDLKNDPKEEYNLAGIAAFTKPQNRLKKELIGRYENYPDLGFVSNGKLIIREPENKSEIDLRNSDWQGWYFEDAGIDVRH
jgi:arylsulfatase A-like enzyme